jgi:hypothetical protein
MSDRNNWLTALAAEIATAHRASIAATGSALARAAEAGRLLIEAKAALLHGSWLPWLQEAVGFSERTAQNYMRLARLSPAKAQAIADLGVAEALAHLALGRMLDDDARHIREGLAGLQGVAVEIGRHLTEVEARVGQQHYAEFLKRFPWLRCPAVCVDAYQQSKIGIDRAIDVDAVFDLDALADHLGDAGPDQGAPTTG